MENKPTKSKQVVYTRGKIHDLLAQLGQDCRPLKTVKEIRERIDEEVRRFTPKRQGRRKNVDFTLLQTKIEEARQRVTGNDASTIACMAASLYNTEGENYRHAVDKNNIRNYVEKNKLTLPDGVAFSKRRKREKVVVAETN